MVMSHRILSWPGRAEDAGPTVQGEGVKRMIVVPQLHRLDSMDQRNISPPRVSPESAGIPRWEAVILRNLIVGMLGLVLIAAASTASAAITTYSDQATFEASLTGSFSLANLDDQPLVSFVPPYNVEDAGPAAAFATLGIDFQTFNPLVVSGQAFQILVPGRDRLIINGASSSTGGNIIIDLIDPVDGVGAWSNLGDGGRIRAFSGPGLSGTFLGEADMLSGAFGGLISTDPIRSVEITCDFNFDLICGVIDIQHGTKPEAGRVSQLLMSRTPSGDLQLDWQPSCSVDDDDYAVFGGDLGLFTSHSAEVCSTGGLTSAVVPLPGNNRYYLVVPLDGSAEGSYGKDSSGAERPVGIVTCGTQNIATCPTGE